jgi:methyltransferase (TIGR00027 family)
MRRRQSSLTAQGIAYIRAYESSRPPYLRVIDDPYAMQFIDPIWRRVFGVFYAIKDRSSPGVTDFIVARTRYLDLLVEQCVDDGMSQVVILGAGFDSRAYRIKAIEAAKVFEVDHPATQEAKVAKLRRMLGAIPPHVVFVPVDLQSDSLSGGLRSHGYDPTKRACILWEGVTPYLSAVSVDKTLDWVSQNTAEGSLIAFDYILKEALDGTIQRREVASMRGSRHVTGEGLVFGLPKGTAESFLRQHGFVDVHDAASDELTALCFTGTNAGRRVAPVYGVASGRVAGQALRTFENRATDQAQAA